MLPSEKVNKLLGNLRTMEHYRGLVCSLIEANQEEVVEDVLGENVKTYCEKHSLKGMCTLLNSIFISTVYTKR